MSLLSVSLRNIDKIYDRHSVALDFIRASSATYNPATSAVAISTVTAVVRGQVEGAEALRFLTAVSAAMVEQFTRLVSVPAADFVDSSDVAFVPAVGDRLEWRSSSVRQIGEAYTIYRVVQIFPRIIDGTAITYLLSLQDA